MPMTASQTIPSARAYLERNPAYNMDEYDVIDDDVYDEPVFYEPLANTGNPAGSPQVSSTYERLGPEYLRIIG